MLVDLKSGSFLVKGDRGLFISSIGPAAQFIERANMLVLGIKKDSVYEIAKAVRRLGFTAKNVVNGDAIARIT